MPPNKSAKPGASEQQTEATAPPLLDDIQAVLDGLVLRDVVFLKLDAERLETSAAAPEEAPDRVQRSQQLLVRETPTALHARVDTTIASPEAKFQLHALAIYEKSQEFLVSQPVQKEFLEKVGIFTIWPYLRAQLHALCDGLSVERIELPALRQGQIALQIRETHAAEAVHEDSE